MVKQRLQKDSATRNSPGSGAQSREGGMKAEWNRFGPPVAIHIGEEIRK